MMVCPIEVSSAACAPGLGGARCCHETDSEKRPAAELGRPCRKRERVAILAMDGQNPGDRSGEIFSRSCEGSSVETHRRGAGGRRGDDHQARRARSVPAVPCGAADPPPSQELVAAIVERAKKRPIWARTRSILFAECGTASGTDLSRRLSSPFAHNRGCAYGERQRLVFQFERRSRCQRFCQS